MTGHPIPELTRVVTDPDGCKHIQQCSCLWEDGEMINLHWRCPIHGKDQP